MKEKVTKNGIDYVLVGDYYIPDLKLPEEERPIGMYGRMHREYLRENKPMMFDDLVLSGRLWTYLADLNEQAIQRRDVMMSQFMNKENVTEKLKSTNSCEWVRRMNEIRCRVDEIIMNELIYS